MTSFRRFRPTGVTMSRTFGLVCIFFVGCSFEPTIQGSGRLTTETREANAFSAIACEVSCAIEVRKGETSSVELTMDDNLLPMIISEVVDQKLKITSAKNISPDDGAKIVITTPTVHSFSAAGDVKATISELTGEVMEISLEGASSVTGKANGNSLKIEVVGSGDVKLTGVSKALKISIAGSGDIQTNELAADEVQVEIAGSGTVRIQAKKTLDVSIAGSGDVSYTGEATVEQSIAGSGSVRQMNIQGQPAADRSMEGSGNQ